MYRWRGNVPFSTFLSRVSKHLDHDSGVVHGVFTFGLTSLQLLPSFSPIQWSWCTILSLKFFRSSGSPDLSLNNLSEMKEIRIFVLSFSWSFGSLGQNVNNFSEVQGAPGWVSTIFLKFRKPQSASQKCVWGSRSLNLVLNNFSEVQGAPIWV